MVVLTDGLKVLFIFELKEVVIEYPRIFFIDDWRKFL